MKDALIQNEGFVNMLLSQDGLEEELDRELARAIKAAEENEGVSKIRLDFAFKQNTRCDTVIDIVYDVTATPSKPSRTVHHMFKTQRGLVGQKQDQTVLELSVTRQENEG